MDRDGMGTADYSGQPALVVLVLFGPTGHDDNSRSFGLCWPFSQEMLDICTSLPTAAILFYEIWRCTELTVHMLQLRGIECSHQ